MSISTLKRKTLEKQNLSHNKSFSLQNSRRVGGSREKVYTPMKGDVFKGHGINDKTNSTPIINRTSNNYDPFDENKKSSVSSFSQLQKKYSYTRRPWPHAVHAVYEQDDYLFYLQNRYFKVFSNEICEPTPLIEEEQHGCCKKKNIVKNTKFMDYDTYYRGRFLALNKLPLHGNDTPYPIMPPKNSIFVQHTYPTKEEVEEKEKCPQEEALQNLRNG